MLSCFRKTAIAVKSISSKRVVACYKVIFASDGISTMAVNKQKNPLRRGLNRILHKFARFFPGSTTLRPALHRLRGVKLGPGVFIGDEVYLENEYPEVVEIGERSVIGLRSVIIAHVGQPGINRGKIAGRVVIGKNVWIGACSFIAASPGASLTIGDGAVIGAGSVIINASVPSQAFVTAPTAEQVGTARVALATARSYDQFLAGLRTLK